jgi:hypothetical protein
LRPEALDFTAGVFLIRGFFFVFSFFDLHNAKQAVAATQSLWKRKFHIP